MAARYDNDDDDDDDLKRRTKLFETRLYCSNLIKGINNWVVPIVRISGQFLRWTREKLKHIDLRIRKLVTIHKAQTDCLCQEKKEEEDLPAFKIVLMNRYNDSMSTYTSAEEN